MKKIDCYISKEAPNVRSGLWLKPVKGGYAIYVLDSAKWNPLVLMDDKNTSSEADDVVQDLIGSIEDKKTDNTINGAKAYAKDAADAVVGTVSDEKNDMTLYGLKAYIDDALAG